MHYCPSPTQNLRSTLTLRCLPPYLSTLSLASKNPISRTSNRILSRSSPRTPSLSHPTPSSQTSQNLFTSTRLPISHRHRHSLLLHHPINTMPNLNPNLYPNRVGVLQSWDGSSAQKFKPLRLMLALRSWI